MRVFFASSNEHKYTELNSIIKKDANNKCELVLHNIAISELQTNTSEELIRHKVLEAYKEIQRPVLVEHTALEIDAFCNLPGLQTKPFYDKIAAQGIVDYCKYKKNFCAKAVSWLGFCDGKKIIISEGQLMGSIVSKLDENLEAFDWDRIFIPEVEENKERKTFAELGELKNHISMRKIAWVELCQKVPQLVQEEEKESGYQSVVKTLAKLINEQKVLLFIGAGISASMELPSWNQLLGDLGEKLEFDKDIFLAYGDYMVLAEYVKNSQKGLWENFLTEKFDLSQSEDYKEKLGNSEIYKMIAELNFPVIYTTNYDHLLEDYFEQKKIPYKSVVKIDDMESAFQGIRIMKFHGDMSSSESTVLSESEYFKRMDFQDFRDIQLQADLLHYHVLFLGYSLSDINVKLMLYRARKRWKENGKEAFIFSATPNQVRAKVFSFNSITTINGRQADKYEGTLQFLKDLCQAKRDIGGKKGASAAE